MPHRGAVVTGLSLQEVEDIFQLRVQLEPQLLLLSAPHLSHDEIRDLDALAQEYGAALETGEVLRWGDLNSRFHLDLLRHANRPRSLTIVAGLLQDCERPTRLQISTSNDATRALSEHARSSTCARRAGFRRPRPACAAISSMSALPSSPSTGVLSPGPDRT